MMSFGKAKIFMTLAAFLYLFSLQKICLARQVGPTKFQDAYNAENINMKLRGAGLKKVLVFKIVTVGLYLMEGHSVQDVLMNIPKRLEVNYLFNTKRTELVRQTIRGINKNVDRREFKRLKPKIDQINSYYPEIKAGDQIAITYLPDVGTQVAVNGETKGVVAGEDFARAFFAIWVGDNPVDGRMKRLLLGGS